MRGETLRFIAKLEQARDFNPLPSHEGRPIPAISAMQSSKFQSTPLTRGETNPCFDSKEAAQISIHSPHTRGDRDIPRLSVLRIFQSTPLMRGETLLVRKQAHKAIFQSTPLMRGETIQKDVRQLDSAFQSTPLMRGETIGQ